MATGMLLKILIAAIGGLAGLVFMLVHPSGAGLFLVLVSPFDALFSVVFGFFGNLVTFLPLVALLIIVRPARWTTVFLGTLTQQLLLILLLVLGVSHAIIIPEFGSDPINEYLRKFTLLALVGIFAWSMRGGINLGLMNRVFVLSTAAYTVLSMLDFYLGMGLLPSGTEKALGVAGQTLEDVSRVHDLRYRGGGLPINRTANWLIVPCFLGTAWFMLTRSTRQKAIALVLTAICVSGIVATISRSAVLALVVGALVLLPTVFRLNASQLAGAVIGMITLVVMSYFFINEIGFLEAFESRFEGTEGAQAPTKRLVVYAAALRVFASSPLIGIGDSTTNLSPVGMGLGAHNSFLAILAEAGLLGFIPYTALHVYVVWRLMMPRPLGGAEFERWRPYFLAAFVATMVQNMFNEYSWERPLWYCVAFVAAQEYAEGAERIKRARERAAGAFAPSAPRPAAVARDPVVRTPPG